MWSVASLASHDMLSPGPGILGVDEACFVYFCIIPNSDPVFFAFLEVSFVLFRWGLCINF